MALCKRSTTGRWIFFLEIQRKKAVILKIRAKLEEIMMRKINYQPHNPNCSGLGCTKVVSSAKI